MATITERLQRQVNEFTENTSAHGIGRIGNRQRPLWYGISNADLLGIFLAG